MIATTTLNSFETPKASIQPTTYNNINIKNNILTEYVTNPTSINLKSKSTVTSEIQETFSSNIPLVKNTELIIKSINSSNFKIEDITTTMQSIIVSSSNPDIDYNLKIATEQTTTNNIFTNLLSLTPKAEIEKTTTFQSLTKTLKSKNDKSKNLSTFYSSGKVIITNFF